MPSYIIFHPDKSRDSIPVTANILEGSHSIPSEWRGLVKVDKEGGNEDPWCITQPWLYSYCHATQLRRKEMESGDILFFVSGEQADQDQIVCDTVFVINEKLEWGRNNAGRKWEPTGLPASLKHYEEDNTQEWIRHLRFGLPPKPQHKGRYTFTGLRYTDNDKLYSFLPLIKSGENVSIALKSIPPDLCEKIQMKRKGKFPVIITDDEAKYLFSLIRKTAKIAVVEIKESPSPKTTGKGCNPSAC